MWTVYVHIDKGVFKVPLSYLIAPGDDTQQPPADTDPLSAASQDKVADTIIQGNIDHPADLKFEHLDLALDNNSSGQGVVVQLGSFQVSTRARALTFTILHFAHVACLNSTDISCPLRVCVFVCTFHFVIRVGYWIRPS